MIPALSPSPPTFLSSPPGVAGGDATAFTLVLADLTALAPTVPPQRHELAAPGEPLPDAPTQPAAEDPLAWLTPEQPLAGLASASADAGLIVTPALTEPVRVFGKDPHPGVTGAPRPFPDLPAIRPTSPAVRTAETLAGEREPSAGRPLTRTGLDGALQVGPTPLPPLPAKIVEASGSHIEKPADATEPAGEPGGQETSPLAALNSRPELFPVYALIAPAPSAVPQPSTELHANPEPAQKPVSIGAAVERGITVPRPLPTPPVSAATVKSSENGMSGREAGLAAPSPASPGTGEPHQTVAPPASPVTWPMRAEHPARPGGETTAPALVTQGPIVPTPALLSPTVLPPPPSTAVATPVAPAPAPVQAEATASPESITASDEPSPEPAARTPAAPPAAPVAQQQLQTSVLRAPNSGPAFQVFAAELRRGARDARPGVAPETMVHMLAAPLQPAASGGTVAAPLIDLRQDHWPHVMVERIERLRDAADAADTRIRLVPDALGAVEVSVKREGDAVHVHFAAEQAATRAALQDAAPRLAEAAEARGLKLGQMGVGAGGHGGGADPNGRQPQPGASAPLSPARARADAPTADETDTRIA